jgi:hypothetical protein
MLPEQPIVALQKYAIHFYVKKALPHKNTAAGICLLRRKGGECVCSEVKLTIVNIASLSRQIIASANQSFVIGTEGDGIDKHKKRKFI